jgi:hypothetical protein
MNSSQKDAGRPRTDHKTDKQKTSAQAPWPDHKTREEMSDADLACDTLGKHDKNADWKRKW